MADQIVAGTLYVLVGDRPIALATGDVTFSDATMETETITGPDGTATGSRVLGIRGPNVPPFIEVSDATDTDARLLADLQGKVGQTVQAERRDGLKLLLTDAVLVGRPTRNLSQGSIDTLRFEGSKLRIT